MKRRYIYKQNNFPNNFNFRNNKKYLRQEEIQDANIVPYSEFDKGIHELENKKLQLFDKAIRSGDPEVIMKAQNYFKNGKLQNMTGEKIKSMLVDPLDYASSFGYKDKPTRLTYYTLKKMASTPFTALIINTRINQVLSFCVPQPDDYSIGFKIKMRDRNKKPNKQNLKEMDELTKFLLDGGQGGYKWGRDDFNDFIAKIVRDSLTYDQYTFEIIETRKGVPYEFIATDASTFRIAFPDDKDIEYRPDPLTGQKCRPKIVQIYNGSIENEYYPWELCFGVRRPRTDLDIAGYGFAELEELVNVITSLLYSDEYNRRFFSQGSVPKGMIRLSSDHGLNDEALKEFKRQWQMQMAGVYNSWKTPIMEADKMEWIDLTKSNRDMEYSNWQNYLIKIHSALFLMDPSEFNFDIQRSGSDGGLFESDKMKRIKYSRDKGLAPILNNIQKNINRHLIWRINDEYEFVFVGNDESEKDTLEKRIKELANFKSVDEVRSSFDLKPLGEENGGNLILNGMWMSWYNNKMLSQQNNQQDEEDESDYGDEEQDYNPLTDDEEAEKAVDSNPFVDDLNEFLKKLQ